MLTVYSGNVQPSFIIQVRKVASGVSFPGSTLRKLVVVEPPLIPRPHLVQPLRLAKDPLFAKNTRKASSRAERRHLKRAHQRRWKMKVESNSQDDMVFYSPNLYDAATDLE